MENALSFLTLAKAALNNIPVPALQGALDAVLEAANIYRRLEVNRYQVNTLCTYVQSLHDILEPLIEYGPGKLLSGPLHERLEQLSMDLITSTSDLRGISHFTWLDRLIHRDKLARTIVHTNESIHSALELFQLGGAIRREDMLDGVVAGVAQMATDVAKIDTKFDILAESAYVRKRVTLKPPSAQSQDKHIAASFEASSATTCLEGTRVALLRELHDWATGGSYEGERFCWVNGPPGAGKSTVAKTIATQLKDERLLAASFFFSRGHASRRNPHIVIPALAGQLACFSPAFRQSLAESRTEHPDVDDGTMELQLQHLIITPLQQISVNTPWVIILDALDECNGQTSASSATEILGLLAQYVTQIPSHIRFLIASRPEAAITSAFGTRSLRPLTHTISLHSIDKLLVADDIRRYVYHELAGEWAEREGWTPDKQDLEGLVARAEGLFIFAATSINVIKSALDAGMQLAYTLHRLVHPDLGGLKIALTSLDMLYLQILERVVPQYNVEVVSNYRRVVGAIAHLRNPLSPQGLADLLRLPLHDVISILRPLRSIFLVPKDSKSEIQFYHKSFRDFVTTRPHATSTHQDPSGYDNLLFYDRSARHLRLAEDCLLSMDRVLHRNMSGCDDPLCLNAEIPDLESRMEIQLPSDARYACLHWVFHLSMTTKEGGGILRPHLEDWCRRKMLFWLEVLSLCKVLDQATPCLSAAEKWYKKCDSPDEEVVQLLKDGQSFVRTFFGAIQEGASHIYQSGMPFTPDSRLLENYRQFSNNCVRVIQGRSLEWSPFLWSAKGTSLVTCIAFSPDGTRVASRWDDHTVRVRSSDTGNLLATLNGHTNWVTCFAFSHDGTRIASGSDDHTVRLWSDTGKLLSTLNGHTNSITSIAFSPDSARIASGSRDHTIRLWSSDTGELLSTLTDHTNSVICIAFSPDGTCIASGSRDRTTRLWSYRTGTLLSTTLKGHTRSITCVTFSRDGTRIASGSGDHTVRLWLSNTGELLSTLNGHTNSITSIAFFPDGARLASGSGDRTVRLWATDTGKLLYTLNGHTGWVPCIALSPDGTRIASGANDSTVRLWSDTGKLLSTLNGHTDTVKCIAFSPDGTRVASGSFDGTVRLWSSDASKLLSPLHDHTDMLRCIAFSPDGMRIATGSHDRSIHIWSSDTGKLLSTLSGHTDWVGCIAFSPDGTRVTSGSYNGTVRLWLSSTGKQLATLRGHADFLRCIAFSPDGTRIASGSHDRTICLWSSEKGELLFSLKGHARSVTCIAFSPNGTRIVSGSYDNTVRLWSSDKGELLSTLSGHTRFVTCVAFSPEGTRIASGSHDSTIRLWASDTGKLLSSLNGHTRSVICIAFSPDGVRIMSGSLDHTARLWSSDTGNLLATLNGHTNSVTCIAFSPDGTRVASGSHDRTVRIWSSDTWKLLSSLNGDTDSVTCVAFSYRGDRVLSGSNDGAVRLWSSDTSKLLSTLNDHTDSVRCIALSPNGTLVASGSHDRTIRLWSSDKGELLSTLNGHTRSVTCIMFSPDGTRLASGSYDNTVRLWSSDKGELLSTLSGHSHWVTCIAFSADGTRIASGSDDGTVHIWSSDMGNILSTLEDNTRSVTSITFSPNDMHTVSADASRLVLQWSVDNHHLTLQLQEANSLSYPAGASSDILDVRDNGWLVYRGRHLCWIPHANRSRTRGDLVISSNGHRFCVGSLSTLIILDLPTRVSLDISA